MEAFKNCGPFTGDLSKWETDEMLVFILVDTKDKMAYVLKHNIKFVYEAAMGKTIVLASKSEHPDLFP